MTSFSKKRIHPGLGFEIAFPLTSVGSARKWARATGARSRDLNLVALVSSWRGDSSTTIRPGDRDRDRVDE